MYIEKIILTNFRGASDLTIDLDRHLNVFYGENGAGKSTVLDAAAIMLSWVIARIRYASASGENISDDDIKNDTLFSLLEVVCLLNSEKTINRKIIKWSLFKERAGHEFSSMKNTLSAGNELSALNKFAKSSREEFSRSHENTNLPLFVYYPVGRSVQVTPLKSKEKKKFEIWRGYNNALSGKSDFGSFFSWFKDREDLENEIRLDGDMSYSDRQLHVVREALEQFMPKFKNLRVRRKPLRMEIEKEGEKLIVSQLSDGEKMMIAMVGDLARRLAILNPLNDHGSLKGEGVVLIDEVDMHLHPKWQSVVIEKFRKIFPNIQFIISTHSPHVLNHVQPKNLFVLTQTPENIEVSHPYESYGKNVDRVLEDLMGLETTRPIEIKEKLHHLFVLIAEKNLEEAQKELEILRSEIKEDPELLKAELLIRRMELIGQ